MQMDELKCRKRVLRRYALPNLCMCCNVCLVFSIEGYIKVTINALHHPHRLGYATAADVIEIKGRVACEIDS